MAKHRYSETTPSNILLISDILGFCLSVIPFTLAYTTVIYCAVNLWENKAYFFLFMVISPYLISLHLIANLFILRQFFPKVKPGKFRVGFNLGFLAWSLNFCFNRSIDFSGLKRFIFANNILRYMYLKAMGASIPFKINISTGVDFADLPLISIGEGCTLAEGSFYCAHTFTGELLMLNPVKVGPNVFLGMDVTVGPGTEIGEKSWIGSKNIFIHDKIPSQSLIPNFAWDRGNPERMEKTEVRLGNIKS